MNDIFIEHPVFNNILKEGGGGAWIVKTWEQSHNCSSNGAELEMLLSSEKFIDIIAAKLLKYLSTLGIAKHDGAPAMLLQHI